MTIWWDQLPITVLSFRATVQGSRIGFTDVEIPGLRLRLDACVVHRSTSGKYWVMPQARLRFTDHDVWKRWSERILRQLADQFPADFGDFDQEYPL